MKVIVAVALVAAVGLAAAGCGSGERAGSINVVASTAPTPGNGFSPATLTVIGPTATIPMVKTGTRVKCRGWVGPGVKVPPPGGGVNADEGKGAATPAGTGHSSSLSLRLRHLPNGSVTVSCESSH